MGARGGGIIFVGSGHLGGIPLHNVNQMGTVIFNHCLIFNFLYHILLLCYELTEVSCHNLRDSFFEGPFRGIVFAFVIL